MQHSSLASHVSRHFCVAAPILFVALANDPSGVLLNIPPRTLRWAASWNGFHIGFPTPPARDSKAGAEGSNQMNI